MVKISEEQVYEALSHDWKRVDEVYQEMRRERGLTELSILDKLKYLATFQYPYINKVAFYIHITNLRSRGDIEIRREREDVEIMLSEIRRNPKRVELPQEEIYLPFNPFWFS